MFGTKIVCEQCGRKVKEKQSIYLRGSRFCGEPCIASWQAINPPPTATGSVETLRPELTTLLDQALAESSRRRFYQSGSQFEVDEVQAAFTQFQSYVLRAAPIMRALGFSDAASLVDSFDFQVAWNDGFIQFDVRLLHALRAVRQAL